MIDHRRTVELASGLLVRGLVAGGLVLGTLAAPGSGSFAQIPPAVAPAPGAEPSPAESPGTAPQEAVRVDDPTRTAGGALAAFMSRRDYLTIRELKAVMTPELQARFDHDSVPFNGKKRVRIALFDFSEKDLKPYPPAGKAVRASKPAATPGGGAAAPAGPAGYIATVRTLWEDQGEAVEQRVESMRLVQREDGLWRVATLDRISSDPLRFKEAVPGVTALRLVLRSWVGRDLAGARAGLSPAFLKRYEGREAALRELFVGGTDPHHAAYQILEVKPQGTTIVITRVKLFEASPGRPSSPEGSVRTLRLVKKGPPWFLDSWD